MAADKVTFMCTVNAAADNCMMRLFHHTHTCSEQHHEEIVLSCAVQHLVVVSLVVLL